jgi:hypothetical protein
MVERPEPTTTFVEAAGRCFVSFADPRDLAAPSKVDRQLAAIAAAPGARWSLVTSVDVDGHGRPARLNRVPAATANVARDMLAFRRAPLTLSCMLVEQSLLTEVGEPDSRLDAFAAWDLATRLALAAPGAMVDRPLVARRPSALAASGQHELSIVEAMFRHVRAERGVPSPIPAVLAALGDAAWASGDRAQARELLARSARLDPSVGAVARWAGALVPAAGALDRVRQRRAIRSSTYSEAMAWLRHAGFGAVADPVAIS